MKVWALMFYGVDEAEVHGVVSEKSLADKWIDSEPHYHSAVEFELNAMPKLPEPHIANHRHYLQPSEYYSRIAFESLFRNDKD